MKKEKVSEALLVITVGFVALYFIFKQKHIALLYTALIIGGAGILSAYLGEKIAMVWFKLSELLGYIVPKILLGIVFFVFLYPISLLAKLSKKDHLMLHNKYDSYFITREKKSEKSDFEKTW